MIEMIPYEKLDASDGNNTEACVKKRRPISRKAVFNLIESPQAQFMLISCLMLSLFMSDSWTLGNAPDSENPALYSILCSIIIVFAFEIAVLSFVQKKYFLSFFFWMDIVGTLSIFLDVGWVADLFLPNSANQTGSILRATRAAKLGARYGRFIRLFRLLRFFKYLPCFSKMASAENEGEKEPTMSAIRKVSNELSTGLSLRVAALVMLLVIVVPYLGYNAIENSGDAWASIIAEVLSNNTQSIRTADLNTITTNAHHFFISNTDSELLFVKIQTPWLGNSLFEQVYKTRDVIRQTNIQYFIHTYHISNTISSTSPSDSLDITVAIDNTYPHQQDALFGICLVLLVIFVLFSFTASFQYAIDSLVVVPLERMTNTLRSSASAMLTSLKGNTSKKTEMKVEINDNEDDDDDELEELETQMLEKMVEKLARIVGLMMPGSANIVIDGAVDKNTADYLTQIYSPSAQSTKDHEENVALAEDMISLQLLQSNTNESDNDKDLFLRQVEEVHLIVDPESLHSWHFNIFEHSREDLFVIITYLFASQKFFQEFHIPPATFQAFLMEIATRYLDNSYHNFTHGCDVMHTTYRLMHVPNLNSQFSHLEIFSLLVAALSHDVGHLGVNNPFLIASKHELALMHNDRSPLEYMHCAVLYEVLSKPATNIFVGLTEQQWRESRKIIITTILGTDMSHHADQIRKTQVYLEVNGEDVKKFCAGEKDNIDNLSEESNRLYLMELLLHCSDISNPFKPFNLGAKWADLIAEEFCQQGDRERNEGMAVTPMCDRALMNLCNFQMGFIEFVVTPLITTFVKLLPPLNEIGYTMMNNFQCWGERRKEDISNDANIIDKVEEIKKLDERIEKFKSKFLFLGDFKPLPIPASVLNSPLISSSHSFATPSPIDKKKRRVSISLSMVRTPTHDS